MSMRLLIFAVFAAAMLMASPVAAAQDVTNPPWPKRCPLKIGLLVDQSDSMSARFEEVREATSNVIDALRDKPSQVTIVGFGTIARTVRAGVEVSRSDDRHDLKDAIEELDTGDSTGGATNWDAAFSAVEPLALDVVVLITDGMPTAYGNPPLDSPEQPLAVATATANRLKAAGTRVVAVGIDLRSGADSNLKSITGSQADQDYFTGEQSSLLRRLYDIVASACGVPQEALPRPEPGVIPWNEIGLALLVGLPLLALMAFWLHRRRRGAIGDTPQRAEKQRVTAREVDHSALAEQMRATKRAPPSRRSIPLDFLDSKSPNTKEKP